MNAEVSSREGEVTMNEKINRNAPCVCGSGKKYKKCCLAAQASTATITTVDFEWRKLRQMEGEVIDHHLSPYMTETLPPRVLETAIADLGENIPERLLETIDMELLFHQFTLPWSLFNWISSVRFRIKDYQPSLTVAENYLLFHGDRLAQKEKRFMEAMNQTYYSFYCVEAVEIDRAIVLKDILLGTTQTVKEKTGTLMLKRGAIIFTRILTLNHQSICIGMAPFTLPTDLYDEVLRFKEWLIKEVLLKKSITQTDLREILHEHLLYCFFDLLDFAYNRPMPTLTNTDEELFQPTTTYFKLLLSPEAALKKILPMTLAENHDLFLEEAEKNKDGTIQSIDCPWLKKGNKKNTSWETTVLGHMTMKPKKLILETNSTERAEKGRKLLEKHLGQQIIFQQTHIENLEKKLASMPTRKAAVDDQQQELLQHPEVQAQVKAMAKAHWDNWFDEPIPMLDNQTPKQAAKTKKGREKLDALLMQYEVNDQQKGHHLFSADVAYLKSSLGI